MNERTETIKRKRNRNTKCPHCEIVFLSRKQRHHHVMTSHRNIKRTAIRPAAELYGGEGDH